MSKQKVFIPFRDRGLDPRRGANLEVVQAWWFTHGFDPVIVSDGLEGDAPFNRHRAYNRAVSGNPDVEVFVFTEADMLIHPDQITEAIALATTQTGLVVPFTQYRYLSDSTTGIVRDGYHDLTPEDLVDWWGRSTEDHFGVFQFNPESVMDDGDSIGAVNVVSRATLNLTGGFTEATAGNWYDDNIIEEGFAYLTNPTRWVKGPAVHLYHLPGWTGDHLSEADRAATRKNKNLLVGMRADIRLGRPDKVHALLSHREP